MRVTENSFNNMLVPHLERLERRQFELQTQMATGQRVTNAHDDPAAMGRILNLQSSKRDLIQFTNNANRAESISLAGFNGIKEIQGMVLRAEEIAVSTNTLTGLDAFPAHETEVNALLEQVLDVANAQYQGNYLHNGSNLENPPFSVTRDPTTNEILTVSPAVDTGQTEMYISENQTYQPYSSHATNQEIQSVMENLIQLRDFLKNPSSPTAVADIQSELQDLTANDEVLVAAMSDMGARLSALDVTRDLNERAFTDHEKKISADADVDLSDTIVKLTQAQNAYQAAISTAGSLLNTSLLDFI